MLAHEALAKADWIVQDGGYRPVQPTKQNFLQYSDFVIDILKDWDRRRLARHDHWVRPFVEQWAYLRDNFEEEARRDPAMAYKPMHHVAIEFHRSQARTRYWRGGNRTSKTQSGYIEDYWYATGQHKYRVTPGLPTTVAVLAGLPFKEYAPKVFEQKMLVGEPDNILSPLFPEDGKWFNHYDSRKHIITIACPNCAEEGKAQSCPSHHKKSRIYLLSSEQGIQVLEAFQAGFMHIDEHIPEDYYHASKMRIASVKDSAMIVTGTPLHGPESWETRLLAGKAEGPEAENKYDKTDPNSPPAVSLHQIDQFTAGIVPHSVIRDSMRDMDPFEVESRVYGKPAALAKNPVFDRTNLARIREECARSPRFGQLSVRVPIEEALYKHDVSFEEAESQWAHERYDGDDNVFTGLRVWEEPQDGAQYILAGDVALGLAGRDRSSGTVLKVGKKDGKFHVWKVAEYYGLINVMDYADELKMLGLWYNTALLVPERNGIGAAVMERLRRQLYYPNLYRDANRVEQVDVRPESAYGVDTNQYSKPKMVGIAQKAVKDNWVDIPCVNTIAEMTGFEQERTESGKSTTYRGAGGSRDDRVMSLVIGLYVAITSPVDEFSLPPMFDAEPEQVVKDRDEAYNMEQLLNDIVRGL